MKLAVSLVALIFGASAALTPAVAATIVRNGDRLVLTGPIQAGDDAAFAAAVDSAVRTVVLGSDGGRVNEAMAIGRLIRKRHLETSVPGSCISACALIWAGGVRRSVAGQLAMHCPTFPGELQCYAPARQAIVNYLREMSAPAAVIEMQEAAGSTSSIFLTAAQLAEPVPVADGRPEDRDEDLDEPAPPPRRRPPQYLPPPPPPGWIFIPSEQRAMPCLPTLLTFGVLRFCI